MAHSGQPLFRADHVGSLLRPENLLQARTDLAAGKIDAAALHEIENQAIAEVVKWQEAAGLPAVTDGEFRRENWWIDFIRAIDGIEIRDADDDAEFQQGKGGGSGYKPKVVHATGPVRHPGNILVEDTKYLMGLTDRMVKVTLPSPSRIHFHGGRMAVDPDIYPDMDSFWDDVTGVYRKEIADLEAAGCRYIQIDDPVLTYFLDDRLRENAREIGEDPDELLLTYADAINACVRDRSSDTYLTIHLCRGNARSAWIAQGSYDALAEALFRRVDVDAWFLEYDDERSGGFEPLRWMPDDKAIVLGLISSKFGTMEDRDELRDRIQDAANITGLDRLALSPQCGFASIDIGNLITLEDQANKMELVVSLADEVWK